MVSQNHRSNTVKLVPITEIKPSPENDALYGVIDTKDNDLINLANDILDNGLREPLQLSADGYIVSGHRRFAAAQLCGLTDLPAVRLDACRIGNTPHEWQQLLRAHNHQRVKSSHMRLKEALLDIDPDLAYDQLVQARDARDTDAPPPLAVAGNKVRSDISNRKHEMLLAVLRVIDELKDYWPLSDRQIHYGLLNDPPLRNTSSGKQRCRYQNDRKSYGDLCDLLTRARLSGRIPWDAISDATRPVSGTRYSMDCAVFVDQEMYHFLRGYRRDLLQSQPDHIELIVEKLTVQNIIGSIANQYTMPMTVGRGYCSITPRYEIVQRYLQSGKDRLVLLIASDFDPDGEAIAESFARSIRDDFAVDDLVASKILLRSDQIREWCLPANGLEAKESSSSYKKFVERHGSNEVYELEAVPPTVMRQAVVEAIEGTIDRKAFEAEVAHEKTDAAQLQAMKEVAADAFSDMYGNEP